MNIIRASNKPSVLVLVIIIYLIYLFISHFNARIISLTPENRGRSQFMVLTKVNPKKILLTTLKKHY